MSQVSSEIGTQDLASFADWINYSSFLFIPAVNSILTPFQLPERFLSIDFKEVTFEAAKDYVYLTFAPSFSDSFVDVCRGHMREILKRAIFDTPSVVEVQE